jgi:predicted phosphate transport protein (TIGR00153 family)
MNFNNLFSFFAPKNDDFFPMLNETAHLAVSASELLAKLFDNDDHTDKDEIIKLIKEIEVQGDKVTNKIFKKLEKTFITPFDREDINKITEELEALIDHINYCSQKVMLYSPEKMPESTKHISLLVNAEAVELCEAVKHLKTLKKNATPIKVKCKAIKKLEEEADVEYQKGIISLISTNQNPVEIIKLKEIIEELEETANSVYSTSKVLKMIVVKYA